MTGCFKAAGKKAPGKSGHRFHKNVGLNFKTPKEAIEGEGLRHTHAQLQPMPACMHGAPSRRSPAGSTQLLLRFDAGHYIDKKCPFTGNVSIRGRILSGGAAVQLAVQPQMDRSCSLAVRFAGLRELRAGWRLRQVLHGLLGCRRGEVHQDDQDHRRA